MNRNESREAELDRHQAAEREKKRQEWRVQDFVNAGDDVCNVICQHTPNTRELGLGHKVHFSSMISNKTTGGGLEFRKGIEVFDRLVEAHEVLKVPQWKDDIHSPTWAPDDCNHSRIGNKAEVVGKAMVELEADGNAQYKAYKVSFWIRLPDGDQEAVEVQIALESLPIGWMSHPKFKGFSSIDGSCTGIELDAPRDLPHARVRCNMGSSGSYRSEAYFESTAAFKKSYWEAQRQKNHA